MDPVTGGALIYGGASLLGGLLGNRASRKEASRNRAFQERMRNTQWQAAVTDMEQAGLNPALAYSQGPNAAPGGSMAAQNDVVTPAVSSAMQYKRLNADLRLAEENIRAIQAQRAKTQKEVTQAKWLARKMEADAGMAMGRLASYGISWKGDNLQFTMPGKTGEYPRMTRELLAAIAKSEAEGRKAGLMGDVLSPTADFAERLGELLPLLMLVTQMNPSGLLRGGAAFRKKPPPNVTKYIRNYWRR